MQNCIVLREKWAIFRIARREKVISGSCAVLHCSREPMQVSRSQFFSCKQCKNLLPKLCQPLRHDQFRKFNRYRLLALKRKNYEITYSDITYIFTSLDHYTNRLLCVNARSIVHNCIYI